MSRISPFDFYLSKAAELGIHESDLLARKPLLVSERGKYDLNLDFVDAELFYDARVFYYSCERNGKTLIAASSLVLDLKKLRKPGRSLHRVAEFLHQEFLFALTGQKCGYVNLVVRGRHITSSQSHAERCPAELFEIGREYQPALTWILEDYASSGLSKV